MTRLQHKTLVKVLVSSTPVSSQPDVALDEIFLKCKYDPVTPLSPSPPTQNFQWPLITWDKTETHYLFWKALCSLDSLGLFSLLSHASVSILSTPDTLLALCPLRSRGNFPVCRMFSRFPPTLPSAPVISDLWGGNTLRGTSPGFHGDKVPKKGPLRAPYTSPHGCNLKFICVIIWLMFVLIIKI